MRIYKLFRVNLFVGILFFCSSGAGAQLFDAPWRGFDTGTFGSGFGPQSFAVGDLDADGDADAVAGNSDDGFPGLAVLKNRGDGTFESPSQYPLPYNEVVGEVALSDFDFDGDLDAFATVRGSSDNLAKIAVWRGAGDGGFAARVEFPTGGTGPVGVAVADFTGDNFADVVTANFGFDENTISLLRHNGQTGAAAAFCLISTATAKPMCRFFARQTARGI